MPCSLELGVVLVDVSNVLGLDSFLDKDPNHYGLTGSPTQVERIFPPENNTEHEIWEGGDNVSRLHGVLRKWKFV